MRVERIELNKNVNIVVYDKKGNETKINKGEYAERIAEYTLTGTYKNYKENLPFYKGSDFLDINCKSVHASLYNEKQCVSLEDYLEKDKSNRFCMVFENVMFIINDKQTKLEFLKQFTCSDIESGSHIKKVRLTRNTKGMIKFLEGLA